jgi:hypothetical protein
MAGSPFQTVATAIIAIFEAEFAAEGFKMIPDRLHPALGRHRVDVGISPTEEAPNGRNRLVQETWAEVRFYDLWTDEIDPATQVNPYRITAFAERFRDALRRAHATVPGTGDMWYFDVMRTTYPDDPTGNASRFHMTIRAFGNNSALVETTG